MIGKISLSTCAHRNQGFAETVGKFAALVDTTDLRSGNESEGRICGSSSCAVTAVDSEWRDELSLSRRADDTVKRKQATKTVKVCEYARESFLRKKDVQRKDKLSSTVILLLYHLQL